MPLPSHTQHVTPTAAHDDRKGRRLFSRAALADAALLAILVAAAGTLAILRGQDANWDLQNYHFYDPWAWWNGRTFDRDIGAAQLQTYHNPLLDLPFFAMIEAGLPPRWITFALAIPTGIAAFFLAKLLPLLFANVDVAERKVAVVCAFVIGVTSAMGLATLGTTMNEWPGAALVMAALWLLVRSLVHGDGGALPYRLAISAGALVGLAAGLKLTVATFAVGLCVALAIRAPRDPGGRRRAIAEAVVFGVGVLAGLAVTYGPWGYALWSHFGNPVFPYANTWIQSPWWDSTPVFARIYGPHTLEGRLLFPFHLIGPGEGFVTEVPYRDARFPVAWALAITAGAVWLAWAIARRPMPPIPPGISAAWRLLAAFVVVSFLLWTDQHSIYRYLVVLDLLTGAIIVTLLERLVRPGYLGAIAVVVTIALVATTRAGDWWHVDFGNRWFEVDVPPMQKDAVVLITSDAPLGFVLPFLPADARFVGVQNTINRTGAQNLLAKKADATIRAHAGPLYQLTSPPGRGTWTLAERGLARVESSCATIHTNITRSEIELCRLERRP